ncbi:hypothetical protein HFP15_19195 [Amycolatopsis sp. K13G38]|uniref:Uncharacterized protein n=1 Tax=Amycolatopsis acididurans TaxID=2724524 RepID=A0ABX1J9N5_9PSEU|nr:hypothetical protein [Amycolatopsis acididurans]NKQ55012.1 hypothetical protein [Amycolatopsis acididurans]
MTTTENRQKLFVAVVTKSESFAATVATALACLGTDTRHVTGTRAGTDYVDQWGPVFGTISARAKRFLDEMLPCADVELLTTPNLDDLATELHRRSPQANQHPDRGPQPWAAGVTVLFLIDAATAVPGTDVESRLDAAVSALFRLRDEVGVGLSPYSVFVYDAHNREAVYSRTLGNARKLPDEDWVLGIEAVRTFTDLVQTRVANKHAVIPETDPPASLATALTDFLTEQAGTKWGFHFFTGSIVSKMIQDCSTIAHRAGNPVLRGPSEHSLACGALARWQLQEAPFLMVVTSGMVDELRGTLANLRDSQAKGFIVFGETEPGGWQPFQGTVHHEEDARAVFAARGIPCFYLTDPSRLGQDLAAALRTYHLRKGPVALLASPTVLRCADPVEIPQVTVPKQRSRVSEDTVDAVAHLLNHDPGVLVWQCGHLTAEERSLVYELAHEAGVALVDSLGRPGTVARYHDGQVVDEYLGTLSLYGHSPAVWRLLHPGGRGLGYDEHAIFFMKSRVPDLATPFSEKAFYSRLRVVQVTDTSRHVAPFADIPVVEDLHSFLTRLRPRVEPEQWIVHKRRDAIAVARNAPGDPLATVPSTPMTHEYFFTQLNAVLNDLITQHAYTYTGFYDVGRGGISAVRNLVRTGEGMSGWYGRALMGDALLAIPAVALSSPANILGFIGDGALHLVPSILPSLAQQLRHEGGRIEGNVSIFYLLNGGFSIIRSYRELQHAATADAQMSLMTPVEGDWQAEWGKTTIRHQRLPDVDPDDMATKLLTPATVNLFSVYLAHENEGDTIMPLSRKNWRMP